MGSWACLWVGSWAWVCGWAGLWVGIGWVVGLVELGRLWSWFVGYGFSALWH